MRSGRKEEEGSCTGKLCYGIRLLHENGFSEWLSLGCALAQALKFLTRSKSAGLWIIFAQVRIFRFVAAWVLFLPRRLSRCAVRLVRTELCDLARIGLAAILNFVGSTALRHGSTPFDMRPKMALGNYDRKARSR